MSVSDQRLLGSPSADELSLMLRGFLIRLMALDSQLEDNRGEPFVHSCRRSLMEGETTFAVIVETDDDLEPSTNKPADGVSCLSFTRISHCFASTNSLVTTSLGPSIIRRYPTAVTGQFGGEE
jgi:hypothetical protein